MKGSNPEKGVWFGVTENKHKTYYYPRSGCNALDHELKAEFVGPEHIKMRNPKQFYTDGELIIRTPKATLVIYPDGSIGTSDVNEYKK